ncbi:DNA-processing protein DprA [SCandidatus Aminicenantes bacterium Aminicenantia_JdfR_composite]|nr:DNA-processing protein DprA [SCandidatus Aminicenantes bacterium Aminicenantia_JdfR_composite]MCP2597010.1 DNA-processing protein DprA [Candidatus Aminicenantes bacterium AC-335-G13]
MNSRFSKNKLYWYSLHLLFGTNLKIITKLRERFKKVEEIFEAEPEELEKIGVKKEKVKMLVSREIVAEAFRNLSEVYKKNYEVITIGDEEYPDLLKEIYDPPIVIYCYGKKEVLNQPCIAIVGTRKPTPYGRAVAEKISSELAERGLVIVSGLARGIDSCAHRASLNVGGNTIAVLGSGIDYVYPKENISLFKKIADSGAIITEFPLGSPPHSFHFPIRNRIISGISLAVVVVEAAKRSGSLITARLALEQNREVMAVPGNVTSEYSYGANWLIKNGAKPVTSWEDIVEELPAPLKEEILLKEKEKKREIIKLSPEEERVLNVLKPDEKIHIDVLSQKTDFSISELLSILLNLELKDMVIQHPGKYFQRKII